MTQTLLVTGGAGYIGSHTCAQLLGEGHNVVIFDDLSTGLSDNVDTLRGLYGPDRVAFKRGDINNNQDLKEVFSQYKIDTVIHFAGLKDVTESIQQPIRYFHVNVVGTQSLVAAMQAASVFNLVFSSSASVYGQQAQLPIEEDMAALRPESPYGASKQCCENLLRGLTKSAGSWSIVALRYFNPVGQSAVLNTLAAPHESFGLFAAITKAIHENVPLNIFGDEFDTSDGTALRDFIHIEDLARGHVCAINQLASAKGFDVINLGTGRPYSVMEVVKEFNRQTGGALNYKVASPRDGEIIKSCAAVEKARRTLNWSANTDLSGMVENVLKN